MFSSSVVHIIECPLRSMQESQHSRRPTLPMLQKDTAMPFFATRPYVERRLSDATEIFDTDYEADYSDDESPRRSLDSVS